MWWAHCRQPLRTAAQAIRSSSAEETVPIIIVAIVLGPSLVVFLAGCVLALSRTYGIDRRRIARLRQRHRAI